MAIDTATTYARVRDALFDGADLHHLNITVREMDVLAAMVNRAVNHMSEPREDRLHGREVEVLVGLARGLTYAAIGAEMGLSESTVRKYGTELYRVLGATNRYQAVVLGLVMGDLDLVELAEAVTRDNLAADDDAEATGPARAAA
ncbi:helix-turn-helix transcriptional regulator [Embleya sp. NPDC059237]|uniref:helix-turn-helix domain-containing protein n=1 Tax=Embleya sp. NPDC059237 TaxID=3346784 RepID=UPI0036965EAD